MRKTRLAAVLLAAPLAFAPAASADPLLPGCYGAGGAVYCDPEIRLLPSGGSTPPPVCAGSCVYVDVPNGGVDGDVVCVDYTDATGMPRSQCAVRPPHIVYTVLCGQYDVCV